MCLRRIKSTLGVKSEQLAWYIKRFKVTNLDYKDFGLLRWKVRQYFKWCSIPTFVSYYQNLHKHNAAKSSDYVEQTTGYKTKEASTTTRVKTLSQILEELENDGRD